MDVSLIKPAGLTEGESKVYLALVELGTSTSGPIVEKSGVAKSIVYNLLNSLIEKGLVSYTIKEKTRYYQAEHPNRIVEYMEEKKNQIDANIAQVKDLVPQLVALGKAIPSTSIKVYEGFKGVQTAFEHHESILQPGEYMYSFGVEAFQDKKYHLYWMRYHERRIQNKWLNRLLFNQGTPQDVLENRNSYIGCDSRYMTTDITTPAWVLVFKNIAVLFLQKEDLAVEITNQEIADTFKAYFDHFWQPTTEFKQGKQAEMEKLEKEWKN